MEAESSRATELWGSWGPPEGTAPHQGRSWGAATPLSLPVPGDTPSVCPAVQRGWSCCPSPALTARGAAGTEQDLGQLPGAKWPQGTSRRPESRDRDRDREAARGAAKAL